MCACITPGCEDGEYGINCDGVCDCENSGVCDTPTGTCYCRQGFTGALCEERCPENRFGFNCTGVGGSAVFVFVEVVIVVVVLVLVLVVDVFSDDVNVDNVLISLFLFGISARLNRLAFQSKFSGRINV